MSRRFLGGAVACALLALAVFAAPSVRAQEESVRIQPALIENAVAPGDVFRSTLQISNMAGGPKTLYLLARDVVSVGADGQPVFAPEGVTEPTGLAAWVRIDQRSVLLQPGETKQVSFSITVPKDAYPGGHFGGIFLSSEPPQVGGSGAGSGVGYQVGTLLNLRLAGTAVEEARVREFRTDKQVYSNEEVGFTTKVENLGNVLIRPRGPIDLEDMFGNKVATLVVNQDGAGIFPKGDREFQASWRPQGMAFGRYQAVLALTFGEDGKKTVTSAVSFWVMPLNVIVPIIIGLIVFLGGGYLLLRWYIRKKVREFGGAGASPSAAPVSRLLFVTVATLSIILVFLFALFIFFS